ncbi:Amino_oxidase domain-containing protein [Psidium guajava]|nr:Amino_oxidase domain-containing protein [Psidium guajava]
MPDEYRYKLQKKNFGRFLDRINNCADSTIILDNEKRIVSTCTFEYGVHNQRMLNH